MLITWTDLDGNVKLMRTVQPKLADETNTEYIFKHVHNIKYSNGTIVPIEQLSLINDSDIEAARDDRSGWKLENGKIVNDPSKKTTVINSKAAQLSEQLMTFDKPETMRLEAILDEIYSILDTLSKGGVLKGKQQMLGAIKGRLENKLKDLIK